MASTEETIARLHTGQSAMQNIYISISGLIGAGKTTLARALGKVLNLKVYEEPVTENAYLADFYNDMGKYSFALQVYLLNARFRQQQQIIWDGTGGVQDRTIYEDNVFAKLLRDSGLMEERDYNNYLALFTNMANFMKKPNVIVHLDVSPEESLRRIKMRNRGMETGITLEYLQGLYNAYEDFIADVSRVIPVLRINYNSFRTAEEMADIIKREVESMSNVRYVDPDAPKSGSPQNVHTGVRECVGTRRPSEDQTA